MKVEFNPEFHEVILIDDNDYWVSVEVLPEWLAIIQEHINWKSKTGEGWEPPLARHFIVLLDWCEAFE